MLDCKGKTTEEILRELGRHCGEVDAGEKDIDDTFFGTKFDARELKKACSKGNVGEVLKQLRVFSHNEPSSADLIAELEASMTDSGKSTQSGTVAATLASAMPVRPPLPKPAKLKNQDEAEIRAPVSAAKPAKVASEEAGMEKVGSHQVINTVSAIAVKHKEKAEDSMIKKTTAPTFSVTGENLTRCESAGDDNENRESLGLFDAVMETPMQDVVASADTLMNETNDTDKIIFIPNDKIQPNPKVQNLYPIQPEVFRSLFWAIKGRGVNNGIPFQVGPPDQNGIHLCWDGNTRLAVVTALGLKADLPVKVTKFKSDEDMFLAVTEIQSARRSNNDSVNLVTIEILMDIEAKKAKERQGSRNDLSTSGQSCPEVGMRANEAIAERIQKSASYVKMAKTVLKYPELAEAVKDSVLSINSAFKIIGSPNEELQQDSILFLDTLITCFQKECFKDNNEHAIRIIDEIIMKTMLSKHYKLSSLKIIGDNVAAEKLRIIISEFEAYEKDVALNIKGFKELRYLAQKGFAVQERLDVLRRLTNEGLSSWKKMYSEIREIQNGICKFTLNNSAA